MLKWGKAFWGAAFLGACLFIPYIQQGWSAASAPSAVQGGGWGCSNKNVATSQDETPSTQECESGDSSCLPQSEASDIGICDQPPISCTPGEADSCHEFLLACSERPFAQDLLESELDLICVGQVIGRCAVVKQELDDPTCSAPAADPTRQMCTSGNPQGECQVGDDVACQDLLGSNEPGIICNFGCCGFDEDFDGRIFEFDNCPIVYNPQQADCDADGVGDRCDNCARDFNPSQLDGDRDKLGDVCDPDPDGDGIAASSDNCPEGFNPDQNDSDVDGVGDICDNCPSVYNPSQSDDDLDGVGEACDNCPGIFNPNQEDADHDGQGDACENDFDGDGIPAENDNCPLVANVDQSDRDRDGVGDVCDNCPDNANSDQKDSDRDSQGDVCDSDLDGDGVENAQDLCPERADPSQADFDRDGVGDVCDNCPDMSNDDQASASGYCGDLCSRNCTDLTPELKASDPFYSRMITDCYCPSFDQDGDLVPNGLDNCPQESNPMQEDMDRDGVGDLCDNCPDTPNPGQEDTDGDGLGDACDGSEPLACPLRAPNCPAADGGESICDAAARQAGLTPEQLNCVNDCCVISCRSDAECVVSGAPPLTCQSTPDFGSVCDL